jgi:hypothetical protein
MPVNNVLTLYRSARIFCVITFCVLIREAFLSEVEVRLTMQESKSGRPSLTLLFEVAHLSFVLDT